LINEANVKYEVTTFCQFDILLFVWNSTLQPVCTMHPKVHQNMRGVHHYEKDTIHGNLGAPVKCARIQKHSRKGHFHAYSNANNVLLRKWFFLFVLNQISKKKFSHTHRSIDEGSNWKKRLFLGWSCWL